MPGGKPVTAVPGATPKSPVTTVGPVFVTVEAPRTAKLCAVPSVGAVPWADACTDPAVIRRAVRIASGLTVAKTPLRICLDNER